MLPIAFLGAGAMGEALMRGLLDADVCAPHEILAFDADATRLQNLSADLGFRAASSAEEAVRNASTVVLAVKPQIVGAVLEPLHRVLTSEQTLVSIAAGVSASQLESYFDDAVPVVRVMPNTPALVGAAASALSPGTHAKPAHVEIARQIFGAVGLAIEVPETQMDAVTGLSGSGPAYVYAFIEALSDGGVRMGLPREAATQLAAQTVLGAAQMVLQTGKHPGALKDMVTSPGGTTIAGLHALENGAFRGTTMDAVEAATQRSRELGKK